MDKPFVLRLGAWAPGGRDGFLPPGTKGGGPVLVAISLDDLRGPVSGVVELPLHLFWSGTDSGFSLDDPSGRRQVYQIVLREARRPDGLATFLNGGMLTALWARRALPKPVRKAWEHQPALQPPAARQVTWPAWDRSRSERRRPVLS
jgi:hypothetical protein